MRVLIPTKSLHATAGVRHNERDRSNGQISQTIDVTRYTFANFICIDTPGFADTSGSEQDDANVLKILEFAATEANLTGVVIFLNGTVNRVGTSVRTVLSRLRGNIPDVAMRNIIVILTNCSSQAKSNFDLRVLPFEPCSVVYMNNSAFSSHPSSWSEEDKEALQRDWLDSFSCIEQLLRFISGMTDFSTANFATVLAARRKIMRTFASGMSLIKELGVMETKVLDFEAQITRNNLDIERNKNYTSMSKADNGLSFVASCPFCSSSLKGEALREENRMLERMKQNQIQSGRIVGAPCLKCNHSTCNFNLSRPPDVPCINTQMKLLFENASRNISTLNETLRNAKIVREQIEGRVNFIAKEVEDSCSDIVRVCSRFCFKDECDCLLFQLRATLVLETTIVRKLCSIKMIESLQRIADVVEPRLAATTAVEKIACVVIQRIHRN